MTIISEHRIFAGNSYEIAPDGVRACGYVVGAGSFEIIKRVGLNDFQTSAATDSPSGLIVGGRKRAVHAMTAARPLWCGLRPNSRLRTYGRMTIPSLPGRGRSWLQRW